MWPLLFFSSRGEGKKSEGIAFNLLNYNKSVTGFGVADAYFFSVPTRFVTGSVCMLHMWFTLFFFFSFNSVRGFGDKF